MGIHSEQARELFVDGCNCAQAVLVAFCEETGLTPEAAMKLASPFGGGMGRLREVCGALTGMFIVAGIRYGYCDAHSKELKDAHYQLIQTLAQKFKEENGALTCRELLGLSAGGDSYVSDVRTSEYYKGRPCERFVECAAEILEEYIENQKSEGVI